MKMWRESVRTEKIMEAYTGFAYVYDEYMDNIPYDEWSEYLIELLKENGIEKGQCIAELGCGTGTVTRILDSNGYDCIGIDLSEDMLAIASEKKIGRASCRERTCGILHFLIQLMPW